MTIDSSPDADADALAAMIDHLPAPLASGAAASRFVPDAAGAVALPAARKALLRVVLRRALDDATLEVCAALQGQPAPAPLQFAPFSPHGTALTLWTGGEAAAAMQCTLSAKRNGAALATTDLGEWISLTLVEGNLGRVLAVLGDEKARLRRETARLAAMRTLDFAAGDALDRIGAELAVPRLESETTWNVARSEIVAVPARESDAGYRRRLKIWRPFVAPTPAAVDALVKQVDPRLSLRESNLPMAVAVRIVGSADDASDPARQFLLERVRADYLVFLNNAGPGAAIHAARPQTGDSRTLEMAMRTRLATAFSAAPDAAVAPRLAQALDRAARMLIALDAAPLAIAGAQSGAVGSRYELGMGVSVKLPGAADADALRARLLDAARAPATDSVAEAMILQARASAPAAGDRSLAWLWATAGMGTAHRLDADHVYLSHLSTSGLAIELQRSAGVVTLRAVFNAPGDPGESAALQSALDRAAARATPGYGPVLPADVPAALGGILDLPQDSAANPVLVAAGLPASANGSYAATALDTIPGDLWSLFALDPALAAKVRAGEASAIPALSAIVATLRAAGVVSLLPLMSATRCLLAASVVALPTAGINLGERMATGVRWVAVPLSGSADLANATGFVTNLKLGPGSLAAVVALGYVRDHGPDPYEVRVEMPDGALLGLAAYEQLMNALERIHALGVEVNTWDLRQRHIDLDGDSVADPLPPRLARHYRQFRMPRARGMEEPDASAGVSIPLQSG